MAGAPMLHRTVRVGFIWELLTRKGMIHSFVRRFKAQRHCHPSEGRHPVGTS